MHALYMRVLETDAGLLDRKELLSELGGEGFSPRVSELALKRLTRAGRILGGPKRVSVPIQEIVGAKIIAVTLCGSRREGALG
jgi:hypothetical protein